MKNIAFITGSLGFAGAEKMLAFVAGQLANRGYNCSIININCVPEYVNAQRQIVNENVKVYSIERTKCVKVRKFYIHKIYEIAKDLNPDVIIAFTGFPNFYAKIVSKKLGIPSIMSERGDPYRTSSRSLKSKIVRFVINASRGGVFQTDEAKKYYGKGLRKRGIVIPNPIFIKGELPEVKWEDREKTVVSVGRLDNFQKRYDVMLDAFKLLSEKHPEYILKLYGKGADEEQIKQWVIDKGLADKVKFMGLTTTPMQDIVSDGMFIITSDFEGISNSLLEAMAVGLPCVSTDHTPGGARLLIQDGVNGLLAPVGDAQKLADAMCKFAQDTQLAKSCGEEAKKVIERFDPSKIIDMWENYIVKVIKKC